MRQVLSRRVVGGRGEGELDAGALALLFAADRLDHVAAEIAPKLAGGVDVVSDRFTLSSLAYQGLTTGDLALGRGGERARRDAGRDALPRAPVRRSR